MGKLGSILRKLRSDRGITQEELARRAGLTAGYIRHLEQGVRRNPTMEALLKLGQALELPEVEQHKLLSSGRPRFVKQGISSLAILNAPPSKRRSREQSSLAEKLDATLKNPGVSPAVKDQIEKGVSALLRLAGADTNDRQGNGKT